jgi:hypothetical protein
MLIPNRNGFIHEGFDPPTNLSAREATDFPTGR